MRESEKRLDSARAHIIPIAPAAPPHVPLSAVSFPWRLSAAEHAAPSLHRSASETLHRSCYRVSPCVLNFLFKLGLARRGDAAPSQPDSGNRLDGGGRLMHPSIRF